MKPGRALREAAREYRRKRLARVTDYVDFNELPGVVAVAIDGLPTYGPNGNKVFDAGRPVAYFAPVHWNEEMERWESFAEPPRAPAYVPGSALCGSLPEPKKSLRVRPC